MDPFLGQIIITGYSFTPIRWASCDGQLVSLAENKALFALIGTTYGGDGRTNFALPDLRGQTIVGVGQKPGHRINWQRGDIFGNEVNTLTATNLPPHTHPASFDVSSMSVKSTMKVAQGKGNQNSAAQGYLATGETGSGKVVKPVNNSYSSVATANTELATDAINATITGTGQVTVGANTSGNNRINNIQPSMGMNYIIAMEGAFPSRN